MNPAFLFAATDDLAKQASENQNTIILVVVGVISALDVLRHMTG